MEYRFLGEQLQSFTDNIHREWVMTNGIGGYSGSSILGAHNRTHQAYLIACLHPPVDRYVTFSKTNERLVQDGRVYDLETSQHAGEEMAQTVVDSAELPDAYKAEDTVDVAADFVMRKPIYKTGNQYLTEFVYDGTVSFGYRAGAVTMKKSLALVQGENTVAISYELQNDGEAAEFFITPLMNFREHSGNSTVEDLQFEEIKSEHGFCLIPAKKKELQIRLEMSEGTIEARTERYDVDMQLQTEVDNETPGLDCHYTPYDIKICVPAHSTKQVSLVCRVLQNKDSSLGEEDTKLAPDTAAAIVQAQKDFCNRLIEQAGYGEYDFANTLVVAANQFLSYRESTGLTTVLAGLPWFTDWGRDTMIAYTGLTLATKRFDEARDILKTFAQYVHHGMVPNMFPDNGQEPLYNTVDASLWYFYAVYQYLEYVKTPEAYAYIEKEIYPVLKEIIAAYRKGTDFSIYMEEDGLIHAGSGVDQVTWMDVRVGNWVVTPRHGKPVEINALWYNALKVMELLAAHYGEEPTEYARLAEQVRTSFCEKFWNEDMGCLYDVIDGDEKDDSLRPNQIYAVSLPFTMLPNEKAQSVVQLVWDKLYAGTGMRSLAPEHKDYHPIYCGSLPKRDAAYHQGTSWGFLLGGFVSAYTKVNHHSKEAITQALEFLAPVKEHFRENCIGSICEIFDGDAPHYGRGCYAQAWSVGETLRCYVEDILPYME